MRRGTWLVAMGGVLTASLCLTSASEVGASGSHTVTWFVRANPVENNWERNVAIPGFEKKYPQYHVKLIISPGGASFDEKLAALFAAGTPPDVFSHWGQSGYAAYLARNMVQPLNPYLKKYHYNISFIPPRYLNYFKVKGNLYGIPMQSGPAVLFYNRSLFEKYHVPIPPLSWSDKAWNLTTVVNDALKLTHDTSNPAKAVWGINWRPTWWYWDMGWLWNADPFNATGGPGATAAYRPGDGRVTRAYLRKGEVAALQWEEDLVTKYHVSPPQSGFQQFQTYNDPFASGRFGMEVEGIWYAHNLQTEHVTFKWGVAPWPYGPDGKDTTTTYTDPWMLGRGAKDPDGGFRLIEYLTHGQGLLGFSDVTHFFPLEPSLQNAWARSLASVQGNTLTPYQYIRMAYGGLSHGFESPNHLLVGFSKLITVWGQMATPALNGQKPALAVWKSIVSAWNQDIKAGLQ